MIIILTGQANKFSLPCCTYIFNRSRDNMTIYNLNFGIGWASSVLSMHNFIEETYCMT